MKGLSDVPRVVLFSGHMIDSPDRAAPRFPARKEPDVRSAIRVVLDDWNVGQGDICICGGARGGDILFAEHCLDLGADVRLFMPLAKEPFLEASVRLPAAHDACWEDRFNRILDRGTAYWPPQVPTGAARNNPFSENNARMMDHAITAAKGGPIHALLLWDGQAGDGKGGTADVAARVQEIAEDWTIINPAKLPSG